MDNLSSRLIGLAERVEQASGADRRLGREVLLACDKGFVLFLYRWLDPTASLDAAMSLVPEGQGFGVVTYGDDHSPAPIFANVTISSRHSPSIGTGATHALALTAASLRARAAALRSRAHGADQ